MKTYHTSTTFIHEIQIHEQQYAEKTAFLLYLCIYIDDYKKWTVKSPSSLNLSLRASNTSLPEISLPVF
jgi:hypothetical protein